METGLSELKELFELKDRDLRTYSPLTLAYIGDGVYELVIRTILVKKGNCPVNQLHKKASSLVKAGAQSKMMELLEPDLTEEELAVYKRGRNAHSPTMAKHATMADYRRATGFEALMGYLYLKEDYSRIVRSVDCFICRLSLCFRYLFLHKTIHHLIQLSLSEVICDCVLFLRFSFLSSHFSSGHIKSLRSTNKSQSR